MSSFDLIGGVGIMGVLSPMDTEDNYPVIDPLYGIDGLRNVDSVEELNKFESIICFVSLTFISSILLFL